VTAPGKPAARVTQGGDSPLSSQGLEELPDDGCESLGLGLGQPTACRFPLPFRATGRARPDRVARDNASMGIRAVHIDELSLLQDIERAAGRCFRDIGMSEIADHEPLPLGELARYHRAGLAWVAVDEANAPMAYLIADRVDGNLHIEQVSVHPDSARRGIGRSLLDHLAEHAVADGIPALTLTTFAHVPWNAPYYARCGFRALGESMLTPGLRDIREREAAHGLDRWPQVCMRRAL
jgi:GNAT superfamily N-acetyltransferase